MYHLVLCLIGICYPVFYLVGTYHPVFSLVGTDHPVFSHVDTGHPVFSPVGTYHPVYFLCEIILLVITCYVRIINAGVIIVHASTFS